MARFNDMFVGITVALLFSAQASAQRPRCPGNSGSDYANCCFNAWQSYSSAKEAFESPTPTYVNWVLNTVYSVDTNVPTTTLCDGFVRYKKPLSTSIYTTRETPKPTTYQTIWITKTYNKPAPTCTINPSDCVPFKQAYDSSSSAWMTDNSLPSPTQTIPCTTYMACPTVGVNQGGQDCKLYAEDVTVYYWPVSTTGDFCAATPTVLAGPTKPKSTVISGTTFVSPSIYVQINTAYAKRHQGPYTATPCGYGRSSIFLSFPSAGALSTRQYKPGTATNTKPFNLVDMVTPAPASNYFFGTKTVCTTKSCPTLEVNFTPTMDVPRALMTADPEWKYCTPRSEGFFGTETYIPLETVRPNWPKKN